MAGPFAALLPLIAEIAPHVLKAGAAYVGTSAAATGTAVGSGVAAGATAGTTAAAGSTAGMSGGLGGIISRVMGGVEAFSSKEGLGQGIQQAQELANTIAQIKQSISASHERQAEMVSGAKRKDEFTGATIDNSQNPEHLKALAEITAQRASLEKEAKAKNGQLVDLHSRISVTTNPRNPMDALGKIGGIAGGVSLASQAMGMFGGGGGNRADQGLAAQLANAPRQMAFGPLAGLAGHLPGMKLGQNTMQTALQPLTDLGVGKTEGQVLGSATNYATEGAGKMLNPMAHMRGEVLLHAAKLPGLLQDWGEGLVESKRHLAQFNGTLAQAFAEAERRGIIRSVESGQRTSGATAGLSDALQDLADTVQPMKDAVTIVLSRGVEELVRGVNLSVEIIKGMYEMMKVFAPAIESVEEAILASGRGGGQPAQLVDFLREVNNNDFTRPRRVPKR